MSHRPRKRFGQNFLHDPNVIRRCAQAINASATDTVVEIGPGRGALTAALLEQVETLHAIELDRDLASALSDALGQPPGLVVHTGDALAFDFAALAREGPIRVVGNLPYNISTPLLFHLLAFREHIEDMHFMLQREVVQRMAAQPGTKAYGRLSVMLQLDCQVEPLFEVSAGAFWPPPKVTSAFVRLRPRATTLAAVDDRPALTNLVRTLFSRRRKTIRATLKDSHRAEAIETNGIDPGARPEELSPADFVALARGLAQHEQRKEGSV